MLIVCDDFVRICILYIYLFLLCVSKQLLVVTVTLFSSAIEEETALSCDWSKRYTNIGWYFHSIILLSFIVCLPITSRAQEYLHKFYEITTIFFGARKDFTIIQLIHTISFHSMYLIHTIHSLNRFALSYVDCIDSKLCPWQAKFRFRIEKTFSSAKKKTIQNLSSTCFRCGNKWIYLINSVGIFFHSRQFCLIFFFSEKSGLKCSTAHCSLLQSIFIDMKKYESEERIQS